MNVAKRKLALLLPVLTLLVTLVSACGGSNNNGGNAAEPSASSGTQSETAAPVEGSRSVGGLQVPIVADKLELSLWSPSGGNFRGTDFNEKYSFQQMEENTNVHINFQHSTEASAEAFSLLMSSGKLPDIIYNDLWGTDSGKYGAQGALLPLEDLIDQYAPNFKSSSMTTRISGDKSPRLKGISIICRTSYSIPRI